MLVRIVNMRGVDLTTFDFDYDLTWAAFFTNANGHVYGRYGSRDEGPAERGMSVLGLKFAMESALAAYRADPDASPKRRPTTPFDRVERFSQFKDAKCVHCHQVNDARNEWAWSRHEWTKDRMWNYPPVKNLGVALDVNQGNRIETVDDDGPAARAGLKAGDVLRTLNNVPIASEADLSYALHLAPARGSVAVTWVEPSQGGTGSSQATRARAIELPEGWRRNDISWRGSMWTMPPVVGVYGADLSKGEKEKLGLDEKRLAFSMGDYVPRPARDAGIRARDVIVGVDGELLEMNMLQFNVYVRANYNAGDRLTINVIRDGQRVDLPAVLQGTH